MTLSFNTLLLALYALALVTCSAKGLSNGCVLYLAWVLYWCFRDELYSNGDRFT